MEREVARNLADAVALSPAVQQLVWRSGDEWARRRLAGRIDLADALMDACCDRDDLIPYWAGVSRTDEARLDRAARAATTEMSLMALAGQHRLTPAARALVVAKATRMVAWALLDRDDLDSTQRLEAVRRYVAGGELPVTAARRLAETLGSDASGWVAALEVSRWPQTGALLTAASAPALDLPGVRSALLRALGRLADEPLSEQVPEPVPYGPRQSYGRREILEDAGRAVTALLRCSDLTDEELDSLSMLPWLTDEARRTVDDRARQGVDRLLASLSCRPGDSSTSSSGPYVAGDHGVVLIELMANGSGLRFPAEHLAYEALVHRSQLDERTVRDAVELVRGPRSRELAATLEACGRFDELVVLADLLGIDALEQVTDPLPVLLTLAACGSNTISDRTIPSRYLTEVARRVRPASRLLRQPVMLGVVVAHLETLAPTTFDTALNMLAGWEGDVDALVAASAALVETPEREPR